jgi:hypothetical protein
MDDADNASFLTAVHQTLKPRARFILDTGFVAECLLPHFTERRWLKLGDIYYMSQATYDCLRSRIQTEYTFIRDGKVEVKPTSSRVHTCRELLELFARVGFADVKAAGGIQGEEPKLGSPRMVFTATKK